MKLRAHVPTQQYGFIEIEGDPAEAEEIERLYNHYAEVPVSFKNKTIRLVDFFGNEIDYEPVNHVYSWNGEIYESGSQYAAKFEKPFDKLKISEAMAKRDGIDQQTLLDQWELNADVSRGFGTAIHAALELAEKYGKVHDHPIIKKAVESFRIAHKADKVESEVLVVDHQNKRAGRIDRLQITGKNTCRVQDYKTNADIEKSLEIYWKQLGFYADIVKANKWKVEGLDIFHWNGEWHEYNHQ